jgi:DNA primase
MNYNTLSIDEAKQIDIVDYLEKLGHHPQKIRNNDYWYLSPLRDETQPSFKVNRKLNAWFDHGIGKGGNLIDFGILYHDCSVAELLKELHDIFSFHEPTLTVQQPLANTQKLSEALEPKIKVIAAKPLTHPSLCRYLDDRKIPLELAKRYCQEVEFELYDKQYFAIGFQNKSGGFELRNEHFKGSSSPKDFTLIKQNNSGHIAVFEGFF